MTNLYHATLSSATSNQPLFLFQNGLVRKRSTSTASRSSISSLNNDSMSGPQPKRQRSTGSFGGSTGSFGGSFLQRGGSLAIALQSSRKANYRTSFLGGAKVVDSKGSTGLVHKSVALSHVVFRACDKMSNSSGSMAEAKPKERNTTSLFSKVYTRTR